MKSLLPPKGDHISNDKNNILMLTAATLVMQFDFKMMLNLKTHALSFVIVYNSYKKKTMYLKKELVKKRVGKKHKTVFFSEKRDFLGTTIVCCKLPY